MSFISEFKTIIESDASLNASLTGGIKYGHLPENYDLTKKWLVWDYAKDNQVDTFNNPNAYTNILLYITLTDTDTVSLNGISDRLVAYLNAAKSANIIDINFQSDEKTISLNKATNIYQNTLEFNVVFI